MRDIVLGSRKDFFQPSSLTFHSNRCRYLLHWIANWQTSLEYWSSFSQTVILTKTYHSNRCRFLDTFYIGLPTGRWQSWTMHETKFGIFTPFHSNSEPYKHLSQSNSDPSLKQWSLLISFNCYSDRRTISLYGSPLHMRKERFGFKIPQEILYQKSY